MLYLIKSNQFIKIGYTRDEKSYYSRIRQYHTHNPSTEIIDVVLEGSKEDEHNLHLLLKDYQYNNEWMYNDPEVYRKWYEYNKDKKRFDQNEIKNIVLGTNSSRLYSDQQSSNKSLRQLVQERFGKEGIYTGDEIKQNLKQVYEKLFNKPLKYVTIDLLSKFGYKYVQKLVQNKKKYYIFLDD